MYKPSNTDNISTALYRGMIAVFFQISFACAYTFGAAYWANMVVLIIVDSPKELVNTFV